MIENSFGTIPVKKEKTQVYFLLVHHKKGKHWGFPKGHRELDETPKQTALRELKEETNLNLSKYLHQNSLIESYTFQRDGQMIEKTVEYFLIEASGSIQIEEDEILSARWFLKQEAKEIITYQESRNLLDRAISVLEAT